MNRILLASFFGLGFGLTACGSGDSDDDVKGSPPPVVAGTNDDVHALESGTYYITSLRDVQDGCGKKPNASDDSITQVPFLLTNDGTGTVTIDFCSFNGRSVQGVVRGNSGNLSVIHANRKVGNGDHPAEFGQDCRIDLTATADNRFDGHYVEAQSNRNDLMRQATVDLAECTTSFDFVMEKK